jgi:hypothetical protein
VNRQPLRNYLINGVFPDPDVLSSLATALQVPAAHLWVKWLDLGMSDPLVRIADALERAYPPPVSPVPSTPVGPVTAEDELIALAAAQGDTPLSADEHQSARPPSTRLASPPTKTVRSKAPSA